jgi:hypothetical protein
MVSKVTGILLVVLFVMMTYSVQAEDAAILHSLSTTKTAGYMIWTVQSGKDFISLRCLVTKHPELGHQLRVFDSKQSRPLFEFKRGDSFVGMFPTSDAGDLVTIWLGGSAFHFAVFSFQKDQVILVLEDGSYMMPEFVTIDDSDKPAIIIVSETRRDKNSVRQPTAATIYKWNGDRYSKFKTVDWKNRFKALDK